MRRHVNRHARDRGREVRAVIEVESAQVKVLVGFPLAAVLRNDHPGHGFSTGRRPGMIRTRVGSPP